jgi:uncharacterized RDD family membrane protein YckC
VICQQCGTDNANSRLNCQKCGQSLRSDDVRGVVTCKNHGNRPSTTICHQCLKPICPECTVVVGDKLYCTDDAPVSIPEDEEERIEHLPVGNPATLLHASFASRLESLLLDVYVLSIVAIILVSAFWLVTGNPPAVSVGIGAPTVEQLIYWIVYVILIVAYSVLLTASDGQTLGKQAMRIAVVERDGSAPSLGTIVIRTLGSFVSFVCFGAGFIAILRNPEKQAWHDHWSDTFVISLDEATERL